MLELTRGRHSLVRASGRGLGQWRFTWGCSLLWEILLRLKRLCPNGVGSLDLSMMQPTVGESRERARSTRETRVGRMKAGRLRVIVVVLEESE